MSIEESIADDVADFVRRVVVEVMEANGPDDFIFSLSLSATASGRTEYWTIYDGFGPKYGLAVSPVA